MSLRAWVSFLFFINMIMKDLTQCCSEKHRLLHMLCEVCSTMGVMLTNVGVHLI